MAKLSEILRERGYVYQHSSETLEEITDGAKRTVYLGIDPTADSMHIGNLVALLVLRRFLENGHKVILLTGGGTGMIGDPGGKSEERNLLDDETVQRNTAAVAAQIRTVFGSSDFTEVNNADWLTQLNLIEFLRDTGKYFTVNAMIKKDIVKDRLDKESPISYTEFSYSLLQAYDFYYLNEKYQCDVQIGGSDQWSNIVAGVEFTRRKADRQVYGLTFPLIVNKSTGKKFGKSEEGAVWLDPQKTSPFKFYQFFLNVDDNMVEELLFKFTLLSKSDIDTVLKEPPESRSAQKLLAREVTKLVHGEEAAERSENMSVALFGGAAALSEQFANEVREEGVPVSVGTELVEILVQLGLAASKREARLFLSSGAIAINGEIVSEPRQISESDFLAGIALIKRGKRNVRVVTLG